MQNISRPAPFVLISSNHGTMIVNRNDHHSSPSGATFGVGHQIMTASAFDQDEVNVVLSLLMLRRQAFGDGVVALDCGANIGVHTVEWARLMHGWGAVHAFEPQEKLYYALAGNVIINNCLNVTAHHAAVGAACGAIRIAEPDYLSPASYGSFELRKCDKTEFIGQQIDYANPTRDVRLVSIDSLNLPRVDLLKIDVEGMEEDVLRGAQATLAASKPVVVIEMIKSDPDAISRTLAAAGYVFFPLGVNLLALHASDPALQRVKMKNDVLHLG